MYFFLRIKRIVIFLCSIIIVSVILSSCNKLAGKGQKTDDTTVFSEKTKQIRLEDDYYQYINNSLLQKKKIPADETGWNYFSEIGRKVEDQLNHILKEIVKSKDEYDKRSEKRKIADIYLTASDIERRNLVGYGELKNYLNKIEEAKNIHEYMAAIALIQKELGRGSLIMVSLEADMKDSDHYAVYFGEPDFVIGKEGFEKEYLKETRIAYKIYIENIMKSLGKDHTSAEHIAKQLFAFQKELAKTALSAAQSGDPSNIYHPIKKKELQEIFTNIDINQYLSSIGLSKYTSYIVMNPAMLGKINSFLKEENLELLKYYSAFILASDYSAYGSKETLEAVQDFLQVMKGTKEKTSFEKTVCQQTQNLAEMEFGKLYTEQSFSEEDKESVTRLIEKIITSYDKKLQQLDWMSEDTKKEACKKLKHITVKVGYPMVWDKTLSHAAIIPKEQGGVFINNVLNIDKTKAKKVQKKVGKPVDKEEWGMSPQTVNAYYNPLANEIVFPAAILQPPFFDRDADEAVNLGGIGMVIAHEITHAFDNNGAKYDEYGNLNNWWQETDYNNFSRLNKGVVGYYNNYKVLNQYNVNGELTLGENIADLGAMSCVTDIVGTDKEELQKLFQQYAKIWASKYTREEQLNRLNTDPHSPGKVRVNGVLSSIDKFYYAYSIDHNDKMYVEKEKRARVYN